MKRGLVLGNSHTACLREAWRRAPRPGFTLDFVAAHREQMDGLEFRDGEAVAATDKLCETLDKLGMRRRFRPDEYDFHVVTACQISLFRAVEVARALAVWPDPSGGRMLVSGACFREVLADSLRATTGFRLIDGLAAAGRPILVLPQPFPHEAVLRPDGGFAGFRRIDTTGRGAWLAAMFRAACESAFAGLAEVLHQPAETLVRDLCLAGAYSDGSVMLAVRRHQHKADDVIHANERYGALQMDQVAAALDRAASGASA